MDDTFADHLTQLFYEGAKFELSVTAKKIDDDSVPRPIAFSVSPVAAEPKPFLCQCETCLEVRRKQELEQRRDVARAMNARPADDDLPGQKFSRGARVKVDDEMPVFMSHFDSGFEAIVEYTYGQKFGGDDKNSYSLIKLEGGKPVNSLAWYYEDQLTLVDGDVREGLKIIGKYKGGN